MNAQGEITGVISSYLNIQDCVGANITNINGYLGCSGMRTSLLYVIKLWMHVVHGITGMELCCVG